MNRKPNHTPAQTFTKEQKDWLTELVELYNNNWSDIHKTFVSEIKTKIKKEALRIQYYKWINRNTIVPVHEGFFKEEVDLIISLVKEYRGQVKRAVDKFREISMEIKRTEASVVACYQAYKDKDYSYLESIAELKKTSNDASLHEAFAKGRYSAKEKKFIQDLVTSYGGRENIEENRDVWKKIKFIVEITFNRKIKKNKLKYLHLIWHEKTLFDGAEEDIKLILELYKKHEYDKDKLSKIAQEFAYLTGKMRTIPAIAACYKKNNNKNFDHLPSILDKLTSKKTADSLQEGLNHQEARKKWKREQKRQRTEIDQNQTYLEMPIESSSKISSIKKEASNINHTKIDLTPALYDLYNRQENLNKEYARLTTIYSNSSALIPEIYSKINQFNIAFRLIINNMYINFFAEPENPSWPEIANLACTECGHSDIANTLTTLKDQQDNLKNQYVNVGRFLIHTNFQLPDLLCKMDAIKQEIQFLENQPGQIQASSNKASSNNNTIQSRYMEDTEAPYKKISTQNDNFHQMRFFQPAAPSDTHATEKKNPHTNSIPYNP